VINIARAHFFAPATSRKENGKSQDSRKHRRRDARSFPFLRIREVGQQADHRNAYVTVNTTPLLVGPYTVTTTLPVVAPAGTGATIEFELQFVGVVATPLNVTVLVP
jgi:hypothetical protein